MGFDLVAGNQLFFIPQNFSHLLSDKAEYYPSMAFHDHLFPVLAYAEVRRQKRWQFQLVAPCFSKGQRYLRQRSISSIPATNASNIMAMLFLLFSTGLIVILLVSAS